MTQSLNCKWALKDKTTGLIYPTFTYTSRSSARKASKGRRFKGNYTPVKVPTTFQAAKPVAMFSKAHKTAEFKMMGNSFTSRAIAKAPSITKGYLV